MKLTHGDIWSAAFWFFCGWIVIRILESLINFNPTTSVPDMVFGFVCGAYDMRRKTNRRIETLQKAAEMLREAETRRAYPDAYGSRKP